MLGVIGLRPTPPHQPLADERIRLLEPALVQPGFDDPDRSGASKVFSISSRMRAAARSPRSRGRLDRDEASSQRASRRGSWGSTRSRIGSTASSIRGACRSRMPYPWVARERPLARGPSDRHVSVAHASGRPHKTAHDRSRQAPRPARGRTASRTATNATAAPSPTIMPGSRTPAIPRSRTRRCSPISARRTPISRRRWRRCGRWSTRCSPR